jgi:hypothetical protein
MSKVRVRFVIIDRDPQYITVDHSIQLHGHVTRYAPCSRRVKSERCGTSTRKEGDFNDCAISAAASLSAESMPRAWRASRTLICRGLRLTKLHMIFIPTRCEYTSDMWHPWRIVYSSEYLCKLSGIILNLGRSLVTWQTGFEASVYFRRSKTGLSHPHLTPSTALAVGRNYGFKRQS